MDVTKHEIFRVVTRQVFNAWNEKLFDMDQVVQCIEDLGSLWLAKPRGSNSIPRMLLKIECCLLSDSEREVLGIQKIKTEG